MIGLMLLAPTLLGGCQDYEFKERESEMVVSPDLADLGIVPVGYAVDVVLRLDNIEGGDIEVRSVELTNLEGEYFAGESGLSLTVPEAGTEYINLTYIPEEVGYHIAEVNIISDAKDPEVLVDLRAQAVTVDIEVSPLVVDFGPVDPGDEKTMEVSVTNHGEISIEVSSAAFAVDVGGDFFSSPSAFPFDLEAGQTQLVDVTFTPDDLDPAHSDMSLIGGSLTLGTVHLQGNDCEGGIPDAYDLDADGYTSCGGDCNDDAPDMRPGGYESCDDRDEDCDDITDEGTECYDDDADGFTELDGDCNDGDVDVNPDQPEDYDNGVDDDCDGVVDAGTTDNDGDGYSPDADDCDDDDATAYPGAPEQPDGIDDDCDSIVDEGTDAYDDDGDGYTEDGGDCDDTNDTIYPSAPELEDWADNNCNGRVDEGTDHYDDDGDGFTEDGGDCDDADVNISPAELETVGDGIDNDCDGTIE